MTCKLTRRSNINALITDKFAAKVLSKVERLAASVIYLYVFRLNIAFITNCVLITVFVYVTDMLVISL